MPKTDESKIETHSSERNAKIGGGDYDYDVTNAVWEKNPNEIAAERERKRAFSEFGFLVPFD